MQLYCAECKHVELLDEEDTRLVDDAECPSCGGTETRKVDLDNGN